MTPALLTFSSPALLGTHPTTRLQLPICSPLRQGGRKGYYRSRAATTKRRGRSVLPTALFFGRRKNSDSSEQTTGYSLSERTPVPFLQLLDTLDDLAAPGAYAISDAAGTLQYVGYAKHVGKRLRMHADNIDARSYSFQTYIPRVDKKDVTADLLEGVLEYWVAENGAMPPGNTVDRHLWESFSTTNDDNNNNNSTSSAADAGRGATANRAPASDEPELKIPVRERRTAPRRRSTYYADGRDPVGSASNYNNNYEYEGQKRQGNGSEYDYVEMNVDPLDPFTATSHRRTTRDGIWDPTGGGEDGEDWIPIFGVVGIASIVWLMSVLGGVVSTGAPSLGM